MRCLAALVAALVLTGMARSAAAQTAAPPPTPAYTFTDGLPLYQQNNSLGFTFAPPQEGVSVTALGYANFYSTTAYGLYGTANHDANTPYTVTVYLDATVAPGTHLAQQSVTVDDKSPQPFMFVPLPKPQLLTKGASYTVYATAAAPFARGAAVTPDPQIGFVGNVFDYHQGFPAQADTNRNAGVAFQFTAAAPFGKGTKP